MQRKLLGGISVDFDATGQLLIMYSAFDIFIIHYRYSALGPVWAETRAQSVDWYSSGTLHPGQVLRGILCSWYRASLKSCK